LDLKHLLKRGALLTAANWQTVAIQFVAQTTFQVLLAVPILGAAILVTLLLRADLGDLLQGSLRDIFKTIASTLMSEPVALVAFITAFTLVLFGGSVLMFAVKGGTIEVLLAANADAGPIERQPITFDSLQTAARFTLPRFTDGCARLFRRYLALGALLMVVYALAAAGYLAFVAYGYRFAEGRALMIGWTFIAAVAAAMVVAAITIVNFLYLLLQIVMAAEDCHVLEAVPHVARLIRRRTKELAVVLSAILGLMLLSTGASILATTALGLIAFVPFVGLAAVPLQVFAWLVRGVVFQFVGLTGVATYMRLHFTLQPASVAVPTPDELHQITRA